MKFSQTTISKEGALSGIGLHTGRESGILLKPAPADSGIRFYQDGVFIRPDLERTNTFAREQSLRCSAVTDGRRTVLTVEHLLAAFYGLGISNAEVHVNGPEIPAVDGSARDFVKLIRSLGLKDQKKVASVYRVTEPIFFGEEKKAIAIFPSLRPVLSISYVADYDHPYLKDQKMDLTIGPEVFEKEIAPARTFCTEEEIEGVRERGLALGADEKNVLVIRRDGSHIKKTRFKEECARHKVLDILGDLAPLGFRVHGRVVGIRSGHVLNRKLMLGIKKQKENPS